MTSLLFMLWLVPAPAWKRSTTNWSSNFAGENFFAGGDDGVALFCGEPARLAVGVRGSELDPYVR